MSFEKQHQRHAEADLATSKMERFVIIVNSWKLLTIIAKCSILDVAAALNPPLARWQVTIQSKKYIWNHSQFARAVLGLIHTVAILQEAHHLVRVHTRVWRRPQRDKLPEDYTIWPSKNKIIQESIRNMTH